MRVLAWIFRTILFLAALGFALTNTGITELRFFGVDLVWRAPLVVFLLVFFVAGAALGLLGLVPALYRQRREIGRLRKEVRATVRSAPGTGSLQAPSPDAPIGVDGEPSSRAGLQ